MTDRSFQGLVLSACIAFAGLTSAGEIRVTVKPIKAVYILGEPIVCEFSIRNVSPQEMSILGLEYPDQMGLSFSGQQPPISELGPRVEGRMGVVKLGANEEYCARFALNRYMAISRGGDYRLRYEAAYMLTSIRGLKVDPLRVASESGVVEFGVVAGALGEDLIKSLAQALDQEDPHKVEEAIEMLIWIDDPMAIDLFKKASRITFAKSAAPELVYARWTLLYGLAKFLHLEEARSVFFGIAAEGGERDMKVAYRICMDRSLPVPEAIVKGGLGSNDGSKSYCSLEYLLACGTPAQAEWVVPLTKDENAIIRALAEKMLAKFKEGAEKKREK